MKALGLESLCKTTGGKGLHVVTPFKPSRSHDLTWELAKAFALEVCRQMAADSPDRYLINMSKQKRVGKIFLDYLRNDRMATAVGPLSPRARDGAPVSMPMSWAQVRAGLDPSRFTIRTAPRSDRQVRPVGRLLRSGASLPAGGEEARRQDAALSAMALRASAHHRADGSAIWSKRLPDDDGWQFEPKWDGFRCLVFKSGDDVDLRSKSGKPLSRYFPDVVERVRAPCAKTSFVIDGELIIVDNKALSFEALQLRLHPAASPRRQACRGAARAIAVVRLPGGRPEIPSEGAADRAPRRARGADGERRAMHAALALHARSARGAGLAEAQRARARRRHRQAFGRALTKAASAPCSRSSACAAPTASSAAFAMGPASKLVGSLLLGLYDDEGLLHHVGFTSALCE